MRMIGTIPTDSDAERFSDYLVTQKIDNMVEESSSGGDWTVWIENDDHVDRAKGELAAFLKNPVDPKYGAATRQAETIRKQQEKAEEKRRAKYVDVRTRWGQPRQWMAPVTLALIAISCVVSVGTMSVMGIERARHNVLDWFTFTSVFQPGAYEKWQLERFAAQHGNNIPAAVLSGEAEFEEELNPRPRIARLLELRTGYWFHHLARGQVWRPITPIFIHWSILHLLFNMFWTRDLGGMIELRTGSWKLLALVLACAIIPNTAQYYHHGPSAFGGMSGVVYGLFGYVWVKGRFQPWLGLGISQQSTTIMIAWLFICMTGWLGPIANTAHVVGLLMGAAIAYGPIGVKKFSSKVKAQ